MALKKKSKEGKKRKLNQIQCVCVYVWLSFLLIIITKLKAFPLWYDCNTYGDYFALIFVLLIFFRTLTLGNFHLWVVMLRQDIHRPPFDQQAGQEPLLLWTDWLSYSYTQSSPLALLATVFQTNIICLWDSSCSMASMYCDLHLLISACFFFPESTLRTKMTIDSAPKSRSERVYRRKMKQARVLPG